SSVPHISKTQIENFEVPKFDLIAQRKIASVLSSLDDKIELNNKLNDNLEQMAKTIYDYWFVQFDFPDENGKPYKSSGGKMIYNGQLKREIPAGWEVIKLAEIISVTDGTHDSPKYVSNGFPLVTSKDLNKGGINFSQTNKISKKDYDNINLRSKVSSGDILFSMIGSIGNIYAVNEIDVNFAIKNVALFKTSKKAEFKNFFYQYLYSYDIERYLPNVISGSIQKFIGLSSLRNSPILYNENMINYFDAHTKYIYDRIRTNVLQNQELAQLRDWLLPMLMNGQVAVK
ncbi:MAG: restriction endonuclease subunit S, partial [Pedobacter sp.]